MTDKGDYTRGRNIMPLGPGEEAKAKVYRAKVMSYMLYLPIM